MRTLLSVPMLLGAILPAPAQPNCAEPPMPPRVDGGHVNSDQLRAAVAAAKGFLAESDLYQSCLMGELDAAKTQAGAEGHPLDPALESQMRLRLAANQRTKEKVGVEINTAIAVYKRTHK